MKVVNRCRLYLEVTTLAEISNARGGKIRADIFKGIKNAHTMRKEFFYYTGRQLRRNGTFGDGHCTQHMELH